MKGKIKETAGLPKAKREIFFSFVSGPYQQYPGLTPSSVFRRPNGMLRIKHGQLCAKQSPYLMYYYHSDPQKRNYFSTDSYAFEKQKSFPKYLSLGVGEEGSYIAKKSWLIKFLVHATHKTVVFCSSFRFKNQYLTQVFPNFIEK